MLMHVPERLCTERTKALHELAVQLHEVVRQQTLTGIPFCSEKALPHVLNNACTCLQLAADQQ